MKMFSPVTKYDSEIIKFPRPRVQGCMSHQVRPAWKIHANDCLTSNNSLRMFVDVF